jgi:hypothetical protein
MLNREMQIGNSWVGFIDRVAGGGAGDDDLGADLKKTDGVYFLVARVFRLNLRPAADRAAM